MRVQDTCKQGARKVKRLFEPNDWSTEKRNEVVGALKKSVCGMKLKTHEKGKGGAFFLRRKSRSEIGETQSSKFLPMGMVMTSQRVGDREGLSSGLEFGTKVAAFCAKRLK